MHIVYIRILEYVYLPFENHDSQNVVGFHVEFILYMVLVHSSVKVCQRHTEYTALVRAYVYVHFHKSLV